MRAHSEEIQKAVKAKEPDNDLSPVSVLRTVPALKDFFSSGSTSNKSATLINRETVVDRVALSD